MRPLIAIIVLCILGSYSRADDDPLATDEMKEFAPGAVEIGWKYFKKGDLKTALRRFKMGIRHDREFAPAYYGAAFVYSVQGKLDAAIKNYRETLKLDKDHLYANANLGYALLQKGKDKEALTFLDRALGLSPKCGEAHVSYANYYAKHEKWKEAGESANRAIALGQELHPGFRKLLEDNEIILTKAEKGVARRPATAPDSKPEGKKKPKPESEGRSQ